ncbi:hypothetical protein A2686_00490, partial [Candidatus Woesebacteria bacterium RIFCSPHIGHO2_01_FULL_38_10]
MSSPAQNRKYAVFEVLKKKRKITSVAEELGVARKTIYQWIKRYKDSPFRYKLDAFKPRYIKGNKHPKAYKHRFKNKLLRLIVKNPGLSTTLLAGKLGVGRHAVYSLLEELDLTSKEKRMAFTRLYVGPKRLGKDIKISIVRGILAKEKNISEIAREYHLSRKAIYEWLARYQRDGKVEDKYLRGFEHPKAFREKEERLILSKVTKAPELSIGKLAQKLPYSIHGIYNVLKKYGLTHGGARIAYAASQRSKPSFLPRFLDRIRLVWEEFIPSLAPAPPPSPEGYGEPKPPR